MSPVFMPHPIKPPAGQEASVSFWVIFLAVVGFGAICLYYGYRAQPE